MGIVDRLHNAWRALLARPAPAPPADPDSLTFAEIIAREAHAAATDAEGPPREERREHPRVSAREGTLVLIVDDSPTVVALLGRMLRQNGCRTLEAASAEAGLELVRQQRPDLVFLDIVLPGMDGFAALRSLRRDDETMFIPIVMMSGNLHATEQFYVQRIGADDFMKKPFTRFEVFARIERLLDAELVPRRITGKPATA